MRPLAILFLCAVCTVRAQPDLSPPDTTETADSVVIRMMSGIGDAVSGDPMIAMTHTEWHASDARTLPDLFMYLPGSFVQRIGEDGRPAQGWYLGTPTSFDGLATDGLSPGQAMFSQHRIATIPLEFISDIEKLQGPASLLAGARWNLRTQQSASPEPRTAIRFTQSPDETILSDGSFSQNVARSTNLHIGFQRRASNGRYENSGLDSWGFRARLRYNVLPWLNLMGTWVYDKTSFGSNGGVDLARTRAIFDEVSALVLEPTAYELQTRGLVSLHALADLLGDSLSTTRFIVAHGDHEREFHRIRSTPYAPPVREFAIFGITQMKLEQSISLPSVQLRGMIQTDREKTVDSTVLRAVDRTLATAGISAEIKLFSAVRPSAGFRIDNGPGGSRSSFALAMDVSVLDDIALHTSYEQHATFPDLRSVAWDDSLVAMPSALPAGTDRIFMAGIQWTPGEGTRYSIEGFRRRMTDRPFFYRDTDVSGSTVIRGSSAPTEISGVTVAGRISFGQFYLDGWLTAVEVDADARIERSIPPLWALWEVGWKGRLFDDELGLKVAVRGTYYDRYDGISYDPRSGIFLSGTPNKIGRMTYLDGYISMDIGNATMMLSWKNIINTNSFMLDTFPMPNRQFTLGVRWRFYD